MKRAISALLKNRGLDVVKAEISDPHKASILSLFSINPQDPHIAVDQAFSGT